MCEYLDKEGFCKLSVFYPQFVYPCNIKFCFKKELETKNEKRKNIESF